MAKIGLVLAAAHALGNPPLVQKHSSLCFDLRLIVRFVFFPVGTRKSTADFLTPSAGTIGHVRMYRAGSNKSATA